jgi:NAD-dependent deacetylase
LTGAGISAESGVPTFRDGLTGLWETYRPEDLATPQGFRRDPEMVWRWYRMRRLAVAKATPNPGHEALRAIEQRVPRFSLVTQNVDGLHGRAGHRDVIELHGNLARVKCFECDRVAERFDDTDELPRCEHCSGPLRPDVVWFGELLPREAMERAARAARTADVFFSIGTSNLVEPAASLPWSAARNRATVIVINTTDERQRSGPNIHHLLGRSGEVLPALVAAAWP